MPREFVEIALRSVPAGATFLRVGAPALVPTASALERAAERAFRPAAEAAAKALGGYALWLEEELLPKARGKFAIGAENYRLKLLYDEMVDVPLPRLLKIGYAQLRKDQQALVEAARRIEFSPRKSNARAAENTSGDHPCGPQGCCPQMSSPTATRTCASVAQIPLARSKTTQPSIAHEYTVPAIIQSKPSREHARPSDY